MSVRPLIAVSIWEFRRFCKLKDLLLALVFWALGGLGYAAVMAIVAWNTASDRPRIVVLNEGVLAFEAADLLDIETAGDRDEPTLRDAVGEGELDALLILRGTDRAELVAPGERLWHARLQAVLDAALREVRLHEADLSADDLARITASFDLELVSASGQSSKTGPFAKIAGFVFMGLMMLGILLGNSYLFVGITGEKQNRVTEQVVAAISPQCWIDGKIIGLSLMVFVLLANVCIGALLANLILAAFGLGFDLSGAAAQPVLIIQLILLALLGFFLWFTFFAAIAATIDDPNTSARSSFLFLPVVPLALALLAFVNPDTALLRFLALMPPTAPTVMPARLLLTDVAAWEFLAAVGLLVVSIWLLRRAAGKIFALGILMHGTEPRCAHAALAQDVVSGSDQAGSLNRWTSTAQPSGSRV